MKFRVPAYTICIIFIMLLQSTIFNYLRVYNVKPNLLIVFIISVALLRGNFEGAAIGFFSGLAQDIITGKIIGFYALLGLYLGLAIGSVNKRLYRDNLLVAVFFTFVSTIIYECTVFFLAALLPEVLLTKNSQIDLLFALRKIVLPEAIYNSLISIPVYILVIKFNYRLEDTSKGARKY